MADAALGTGNAESGFAAVTGDTTLGALSVTGSPVDAATFGPVAALRPVLPATAIAGFPALDFNGAARTWPGAPGAVN